MASVFLNPGHAPAGDPDPGAVNERFNLRECDIVLAVAKQTAAYLEAVGYATRVFQHESGDTIVKEANDGEYDVFVAIHCNSSEDHSSCGTESWYYQGSTAGAQLAMRSQSQIVNSLPVADRGIKAISGDNDRSVLAYTTMPACLIELAFLSHEADAKLLGASDGQDQFSRAIARAISDYFVFSKK
ncbi:MAG: N-acetylmuramoyl-L-alanine amidase [Sporomusaceae bacterium]|nr:N-acetylmuramoyl-L-alanine amidase [Sporomusaceae bacterium]